MLRRRQALLALRERLPALARLAGLHVRELGAASVVVTARPALALHELDPGIWLIDDSSYGAGSGTTTWQHITLTPHARLLTDAASNASHLCAVASALYTRNAALHAASVLEHYEINCVVEARARSGAFGAALRAAGYRGHIVSVEPDPGLADLLSRRADGDAPWHAFPLALGSENGVADLPDVAEPVQVRRLDEVLDDLPGNPSITRLFLKVDTPGGEAEILAGAGERIADVAALQTVLTAMRTDGGPAQVGAAAARLEAAGFEVTGLFPTRCDDGRMRELAAFFARSAPDQTSASAAASGGHAEVSEVWAREQAVSMVFRVQPPAGRAATVDTVLLRTRKGQALRRYLVRPDERGDLRVDIPIADLDPAVRPAEAIWDVFALVTLDGGEQVEYRLGKHLDDIVGKKRIITFPSQRPEGDESFTVTPYYTAHDDLSIRCHPAASR